VGGKLSSNDSSFPANGLHWKKRTCQPFAVAFGEHEKIFRDFAQIKLGLQHSIGSDWVNQALDICEQLSSHLWTTAPALRVSQRLPEYFRPLDAPIPRLRPEIPESGHHDCWALSASEYPLFRKLRPHWAFYTTVDARMFGSVAGICGQRAKAQPVPYASLVHDGGKEVAPDPSLTSWFSYAALEPVGNLLLAKCQKQSDSPDVSRKFAAPRMAGAGAAIRPSARQLPTR